MKRKNGAAVMTQSLTYVNASRSISYEIIRNYNSRQKLRLLEAMLIRLQFSFDSRWKVPISSRISSFLCSFVGPFHRDSFVRTKIAKIPSLLRMRYVFFLFSFPSSTHGLRSLWNFTSLILSFCYVRGLPSGRPIIPYFATTTTMTMTHVSLTNRIKRTRKLFRKACFTHGDGSCETTESRVS